MFKIGMIGAENSHAEALATLFREDEAFSDICVVAVGGDYPEENQKFAEKFGAELITGDPAQMLGRVDAVMITARDGARHAAFAKPFLEAGIPMFIDKPFTTNVDEAIELVRRAKQKGVLLSGGSILKYSYEIMALAYEAKKRGEELRGGTVTAPVKIDSPYSGFFFYSSHLVEMMLAVFGNNPKSVTARRHGDSVTAIVDYSNYSVVNCFVGNCNKYATQVFSNKGIYTREVEVNFATQELAQRFVNMLRTGKMPQSYEELVYPVAVMDAIKRSYETEKTVDIQPVTI